MCSAIACTVQLSCNKKSSLEGCALHSRQNLKPTRSALYNLQQHGGWISYIKYLIITTSCILDAFHSTTTTNHILPLIYCKKFIIHLQLRCSRAACARSIAESLCSTCRHLIQRLRFILMLNCMPPSAYGSQASSFQADVLTLHQLALDSYLLDFRTRRAMCPNHSLCCTPQRSLHCTARP
jgi:hypothetical protein